MLLIDESYYVRPPKVPDRISAGGIVVRIEDGLPHIALVLEGDLSHYVLPKGRVEAGEDEEMAARREIAEEAGIFQLQRVTYLGERQRLAYNRKTWITTHYFLFLSEQVETQPTDTDHPYVSRWFTLDALPPILWPEQQRLIEETRPAIEDLARGQRAAAAG